MNLSPNAMHLTDLIPILQMAIGPVIVISGVGLLLLSMTNRLGRVIDRSRLTAAAFRGAAPGERDHLEAQLHILSHRSHLIRLAIILSTVSVLFAGALIISLFLAILLRWEIGAVVIILFIACMTSLIGSLLVFLRDINLSLAALKLEVEAAVRET